MTWQFTFYITALLLAGSISGLMTIVAWRRRSMPGSLTLALLMLAVTEWAMTAALEVTAADQPTKILWSKIQYLGIVSAPTLVLLFALEYTHQDEWFARYPLRIGLLWIIPVITLLLVWTNEFHHLIWTKIEATDIDPRILDYEHGWWFYLFQASAYVQVVIGIAALSWAIIHFPDLYQQQIVVLLISAVLPLIGNIIYTFLNPLPGLDWTPVAFTLTSLALGAGILRFRLLDLAPIARDAVIESMDSGVLVLDGHDRIADINPAAQRILELAALHVIGQDIQAVLPRWTDWVEPGQDSVEFQLEPHEAGQVPRYVALHASLLLNRRGQLTGRLFTFHDITERRSSEERLRQLSRAVEQSPATVVITDTGGAIQYVNLKFTQLTGYTFEEAIGQNPRILKSGHTSPEEYQKMWQIILAGGTWHGELLNKKKNGELYWESAVISPITDPQGNPTHFLAVKEDITERKRIQAAEQEQRALAESLRDTAAALNSTLDLEQVLDRILTNIGRVVPHDACAILLIDPASGVVQIARSRGYAQSGEDVQTQAMQVSVMDAPNMLLMTEKGRPIVVADTQTAPEGSVAAHPQWLRSYAAAPIRVKGQTAGFLYVNSAAPGFFTQAHAERLQAFADQAAIAIENARLFEETQQRNQRLALVNEISVAINQPGELQAVLQTAVDGLMRALNVHQAGVSLFDETHQHLTVMADRPAPGNASAVGIEIPIEGNLSMQRILATQAPLQIEDVQNDPLTSNVRDILARQRVYSILLVPLIVRDQVVGTIGCDATDVPRQFAPEEIELAQTVANLVALRIEQARLFEAEHNARQQLQQRANDLSGLYSVTRATSRSLATEDVLAQGLSSALVILGFEAGLIALADPDQPAARLAVAAERGIPAAILARLRSGGLDNTLISYVHDQREILVIDDLEHETATAIQFMSAEMRAGGWRSYIGIPLLHQEQSLGTLCLFARQPRLMSQYDTVLLSSIGHQVATAIANARLFQTTLSERSRLKALIESSRDGIILSTLDGHILITNVPALQMLHLPGQPQDWLGVALKQAIGHLRDPAPRAHEIALGELERIQTGNEPPTEGDFDIPPRALRWQSLPVRVGAWPMGHLFVMRDTTEERAIERMREDMTHTMVHDLRNPLSGISTALDFLNSGMMGKLTSQQLDMVEIARRSTHRMLDIVNAILDVSRLEAGPQSVPLDQEAFSVSELLNEAVQMQVALANEKNVRLECDANLTLPPAWADTRTIQRVLQNLIGNAIKFTPTGGTVRVSAKPENRDDRAVILVSVRDTGPGIPPQIQGRLFQKFVTGGQEESGSGLGLAFCRLALEAHGERIWVAGAPGEGATFTFSLAVADLPTGMQV